MIAFLCLVIAVHDGDTLRCASGERVRIAGIESNELRGGCHLPRCAPLSGPEARAVATRLVLRRTLHCEALGRSYNRVVASCTLDQRDIGCAFVAAGAAIEWPHYRRKFRLGPCRVRVGVGADRVPGRRPPHLFPLRNQEDQVMSINELYEFPQSDGQQPGPVARGAAQYVVTIPGREERFLVTADRVIKDDRCVEFLFEGRTVGFFDRPLSFVEVA
ncbi:MAG: hypothetical protein K2X76_16110 [Sphingomonas sp.]|nr:hypothetical protein [Sphingomonas sp.]